jgi:hypothetical protein
MSAGSVQVFKQIAKRLARPLTTRILGRMDARVAPVRNDLRAVSAEMEPLRSDIGVIKEHLAPALARVQTHERVTAAHTAALAELSEGTSAINRHLPALLNTISAQNAAVREARRTELQLREEMAGLRQGLEDETVHLNKRVDETAALLAERMARVEQRAEFIRREVLFESRYGGRTKGMTPSAPPEVVAPKKLAAAADLRLNLGCGHVPLEGYLNVDGRPLDGVDIVADVGDLPFEPGSVAVIYSAHLLEHFPLEETRRRLLPYWLDLLEPGGTFTVIVPDAESMLAEHAAGRLPFEDLRLVTFGDQEYDGDFHFNMFSKTSLSNLLTGAGFTDVRVIDAGRRNGVCYEMELSARRPDHA